jgi:hypothetical protein
LIRHLFFIPGQAVFFPLQDVGRLFQLYSFFFICFGLPLQVRDSAIILLIARQLLVRGGGDEKRHALFSGIQKGDPFLNAGGFVLHAVDAAHHG